MSDIEHDVYLALGGNDPDDYGSARAAAVLLAKYVKALEKRLEALEEKDLLK